MNEENISPTTLYGKVYRICAGQVETLLNYLFYLPFGGYSAFLETCRDFTSVDEGDLVLDLCCGTGELTVFLATGKPRVKVAGIDISREEVSKAAAKSGGDSVLFITGTVSDLPITSNRINKCIVSFGLHHLSAGSRLRTFKEIFRVLSPDGSLYICDYHTPESRLRRLPVLILSRLDSSREAYRMVRAGTLLDEIGSTGFRLERKEILWPGMFQLLEFEKTGIK